VCKGKGVSLSWTTKISITQTALHHKPSFINKSYNDKGKELQLETFDINYKGREKSVFLNVAVSAQVK